MTTSTTIAARNGTTILIDAADMERVAGHVWWINSRGYPAAIIDGRPVLLHHLLIAAPPGSEIDHANNDKTDARRSNLRVCTRRQNAWNRPKQRDGASSRFIGVSWHRMAGRWQSQIKIDGRTAYLGLFHSERDAAYAFDQACRATRGEFAVCNFPDDTEDVARHFARMRGELPPQTTARVWIPRPESRP